MKNTKQNTSKSKSKYSGRRPGSFSFVKVSLADLASKFADAQTSIPVSSKWATMLGFVNLTPLSTNQIIEPIKAKKEVTTAVTATDLAVPVSA